MPFYGAGNKSMFANHKGEIPAVILLLPFIAGITCGLNFLDSSINLVLASLLISSALFIGLNLGYTKCRIYKIQWLGGSLITMILFLTGWLITLQHHELNNYDHFSKTPSKYLVADINSEPVVKGDWVRFTAEVKQTIAGNQSPKTSGTLLIAIKDELAKNLFYGEELLLPAKYAPVDPPYNPGEFNYKAYLAHKNIHYQAYLFPKQYTVIKTNQGNMVVAYALKLRQNLVAKLKANMRDTNAIAVASTLILGYKADLSNDILQSYSKTGTIHILSVSGGHVAILYLLLGFTFSFLDSYKRGKMMKAVLIILLIWGYALLSGFSPAVCRAALMISMVICGKTYSRYINTLNILAASAFLLLLYDPFLIADVGFQLSYLAVGGLIVFQPLIFNWFSFKQKWAINLWKLCTVSIAAQAITFPLSAYYFHQFPVYFLISNLLIIIPISMIMYTGILLLALPQIPAVSQWLGYFLEQCILLMNKTLSNVEHWPYAGISKIWLTSFEHILLYVIIIAVFYLLYEPQKWLIKTAGICLLLLSLSISIKKISADQTRSFTFLNLRKHTGIIFKNGSSGVIFSDLTDTDKTFRYSVQPFLDSSRITDFKVYDLNSKIRLNYLIKQQNLVQFLNKKFLLTDNTVKNNLIPEDLNIGYRYISHNPHLDTTTKRNTLLIIDGSNSEPYISKLRLSAKKNKTVYYILKRNKAITILSN